METFLSSDFDLPQMSKYDLYSTSSFYLLSLSFITMIKINFKDKPLTMYAYVHTYIYIYVYIYTHTTYILTLLKLSKSHTVSHISVIVSHYYCCVLAIRLVIIPSFYNCRYNILCFKVVLNSYIFNYLTFAIKEAGIYINHI